MTNLLKRLHIKLCKVVILISITTIYSCKTPKFVHDYPEWDFYDNKNITHTENNSPNIEQFPKDASDWSYFKAPYRKVMVSAWIGEICDTLFFEKIESYVKSHPDYNSKTRFVNLWISSSIPHEDESVDKNNCLVTIQLLTPYYPGVYNDDGVIVPYNGINYIFFPRILEELITIRGLTHIKTFPIIMSPSIEPTIVLVKDNEFRILKKNNEEYRMYMGE